MTAATAQIEPAQRGGLSLGPTANDITATHDILTGEDMDDDTGETVAERRAREAKAAGLETIRAMRERLRATPRWRPPNTPPPEQAPLPPPTSWPRPAPPRVIEGAWSAAEYEAWDPENYDDGEVA